eukprot:TRINITY_DN17643_c0_g1_i1.p1 TRINITY_DN17643_c0_g1~~TRINITY_DN17643_c0_g1_i1.p1  ORF type:complete len:161 (+),score=26.70 TRINITY_DN17643_c0_g1_i1:58-540(+)
MFRRAAQLSAAAVGFGATFAGLKTTVFAESQLSQSRMTQPPASSLKMSSSAQNAMRENLARRLAKSYVLPSKELKAGNKVTLYPIEEPVYNSTSVKSAVIIEQGEPVKVQLSNGETEYVEPNNLHHQQLYQKLKFWEEEDPEMATAIISFIAAEKQGIRL